MEWYWIVGIVVLIVAVALTVYFSTRQQPQAGGLFGTGLFANGSGGAIGSSIGGIFSSLGPVASSIGTAVDSGRTAPSAPEAANPV